MTRGYFFLLVLVAANRSSAGDASWGLATAVTDTAGRFTIIH